MWYVRICTDRGLPARVGVYDNKATNGPVNCCSKLVEICRPLIQVIRVIPGKVSGVYMDLGFSPAKKGLVWFLSQSNLCHICCRCHSGPCRPWPILEVQQLHHITTSSPEAGFLNGNLELFSNFVNCIFFTVLRLTLVIRIQSWRFARELLEICV